MPAKKKAKREFEAIPIREHDKSGRLVAAGAAWTEKSEGVSQGLGLLIALTVAFACFGLPGLFLLRDKTGLFVFFAIMAGLIAALCWVRSRSIWRTRSLVFRDDGSMPMPEGLPAIPRQKEITGSHAYLISIEKWGRAEGYFFVVAYSSGGDIITVAHNLQEWVAHKLAVQLTNALSALRESQANARRARQAAANGQAPRRGRMLID